MKVYVYCPETTSQELHDNNDAIVALLQHTGVITLTKDSPAPHMRDNASASEQTPLDRVDAIVIEGSDPNPEIGYLLAYAIAQKKPLLYMTLRGKTRFNPLATFERNHKVPSSIVMVHYDAKSIEKVLLDFLGRLDTLEVAELPSIKFTLRITPSIERYLEWKTRNTKISKADFVRNILTDEIIAKDEAYKKTSRRVRGKE